MNKYLLPWIILVLTGCTTSMGPTRIHADRNAYNEIVRQTNYEQLLENIVHLSYLEPTSYLKVTNVTASYSLTQGVSATPSWTQAVGSPATYAASVEPSIAYSESPTISYVPLDDANFVMMLQKPISFNDVALLFSGGYDNITLLSKLLFNRVGVLDNASVASSPDVLSPPTYKEYYHFIQILFEMKTKGQVRIEPATIEGQSVIMIQFDKNSVNSVQARQVKKLVQVAPDSENIILVGRNMNVLEINNKNEQLVPVSTVTAMAKNVVYVDMRSIYGVMSFLAHSVQIPEADYKAHLTSQLNDINGRSYDWKPLMKGLMTIYSSDTEPQNAFVKVWTNNHWFYIKETDIPSKITFAFLVRLMTLTSGLGASGVQTAPILTLAV